MSLLNEALKLMELEGDPRNIGKKIATELHRGAASFLQNNQDTVTAKDLRTWIYDTSANIDREEIYANFPHFDSYGKHEDEIVAALNSGDSDVLQYQPYRETPPVREGFRRPLREMDNPADDDYQQYQHDPVRSPSDDEYNKAAAAIKRENPALVIGGIGVDKETGDINIEATLRSGEYTASEHFILRSNGKLDLVNEGFRRPFVRGTRAQHLDRREDREDDEARERFDREGDVDWEIPGARDLANFGRRGNEEEEEDPNVRHSRHMKAFYSHGERADDALEKHRPGRQVHGIDDDPEKDEFHFYDDKGDDWSLDADDNISPRTPNPRLSRGGEEEEGIDDLDRFQKQAGDEDADWNTDMDDDVSPHDITGAEEEEMIDVPCPHCGGKGYHMRGDQGDREDCDECGGKGRVDVPKYQEKDMSEGLERLKHLAGVLTEGKKPAFLKGKDGDDKDDDKDDGKKKKKPAFLNGGNGDDDSDDKDDDKSDKKSDDKDDKDSDDKSDKKKDKKKVDEGMSRLRHLAGVLTEKKAAKDYDGDGKVESSEEEHKGVVDKAIKSKKK